MKEVDILIAGAGPAGIACGIELHRKGRDCLVVDPAAFPRDKLCGGGLTPKAQKQLDELLPGLRYDYLPVRRMTLYMDGRYRGSYPLVDKEIRIVQRKEFDALLLDAYLKEGGAFLQERLGDIREGEDGRLEVTMRSGLQVRCRHLIGADGANSRVRLYLNPAARADTLILEQYSPRCKGEEITIELSRKYPSGYFYIFPNKRFDAVGYCAADTRKEVLVSALKSFGIAETRLQGAFITTRQDYPGHPHIWLVGDAGGWCDNLSYEGLYFALATGRNAAHALLEGRPFRETNAEVMRIKRRRALGARLLYSRPGLALVKLFSRYPGLTRRILNRHVY